MNQMQFNKSSIILFAIIIRIIHGQKVLYFVSGDLRVRCSECNKKELPVFKCEGFRESRDKNYVWRCERFETEYSEYLYNPRITTWGMCELEDDDTCFYPNPKYKLHVNPRKKPCN